MSNPGSTLAIVKGTVLDLETGNPVPDLELMGRGPGKREPRANTKAGGDYVLRFLKSGKVSVRVGRLTIIREPVPKFQPQLRYVFVGMRELEVEQGKVSEADFSVDLKPLENPPYGELDGCFEGVFSCGFEDGVFYPDNPIYLGAGPSGHAVSGAWVEFSPAVFQSVQPWPFDARGWGSYRIKVVGRVRGPGSIPL